jgi:hypothetical protein
MSFAAKNDKKEASPALADILSRMTPATKRKLARGPLGAVSTCPHCAKAFVQRQLPRTFCSRVCSKAHWRQEQARFLEAGRKAIAEYVAQGIQDSGETFDPELKAMLDSAIPTCAEMDQWFGITPTAKEKTPSKARRGHRSRT